MTLSLTTYAGNGNLPLTIAQLDANWTAIANAIDTIVANAFPNVTMGDSPDGLSVQMYVNGAATGGASAKPPRPINNRGTWTTGTAYAPYDAYAYGGSYYLVLLSHTSTTVAADVLNHDSMIIARAGAGYTMRGVYDATVPYSIGDGVTIGGSPVVWVLGVAAPAGTPPNAGVGATNAYWSRATEDTIDSTRVVDAVYGKLSTTLAQIETAITSANASIGTINSSIATEQAAITALQSALATLTSRVSADETTLNADGTLISKSQGDITALQSSLATLTATVSGQTSALGSLQSTVASLSSSNANSGTYATQSSLATLTGRVIVLESAKGTDENTIASQATAIASLQSSRTADESTLATQAAAIASLQSALAALTTTVNNISSGSSSSSKSSGTTASTSTQQQNIQAIEVALAQFNFELAYVTKDAPYNGVAQGTYPIAQAGVTGTWPNTSRAFTYDVTTLTGIGQEIGVVRNNVVALNNALGTLNASAINSLPASTYPVAIPSPWVDTSTSAGVTAALKELAQVITTIVNDFATANQQTIGSLAQGQITQGYAGLNGIANG